MKIISGGQTGADRAALDVAMAMGVDCGGWCPEGRMAEDGPIPLHYPLEALPAAGYPQRTRQNVIDSDGTLILSLGAPDGGTALTVRLCEGMGKPHLVIDGQQVGAADAAMALADFVQREEIQTLNVAGPRASSQPEMYAYTRAVLEHWLTAQREDG